MKKLFVILLVILSFAEAKAQSEKPFQNIPTWYDFGNNIRVSGSLRIPRTLSARADTGMIAYQDGYVWLKDSTGSWLKLARQIDLDFKLDSVRKKAGTDSIFNYYGATAVFAYVDGGSGGGSGTVNSGNQYRIGYYAGAGTAISEAPAITINRALISDGNGVPTHSPVTASELSNLSGTSGNLQTQIDGKVGNATNLSGTGVGIFKTKSGTDLQFKRFKGNFGITLSDDGDSVGVRVDTSGSGIHTENYYNTKYLPVGTSIPAQVNPIAGTNMTITGSYPNLTFNSTGGAASDPVTKFSTGLLQNYNFNKYNKKPNRYELQEFGYSTAVATKNNDALFPTYRDGASAITVNDTSGMYGGWHTTGPTVFDSVYYSLDGFKTKTFLGLQPWGAMHSFPLFEGDDGYWYQIGGDYLSTPTQKKSVWRSATPLNMASWTQMTSTAPFSTILGEATSWNDTLYYMGGQFGTASSISWTNDGKSDTVWRSTDGGANWTFHAKIAGNIINKNISGTGVKFNNRFYLVGGGRYDGTVLSARTFDSTVYSTTDFVNWRQEQSFPGRGVQYPSVTVWDGKLWCIWGDSAQATNTNLIYYMTKDGNWHNYINYDSSGTALPVTHAAAVTVWKDQILIPNGNNLNKAYSIHRSPYISNPDAPITYLTPIRFDTAMGSPITGVQVFGSKYSGSFVEAIKTYYDGTLHFKQKSSINTPAATYTSLYFKTSDGKMYYKTPAGTEYGPITGSNGIEVGVTGITGGTSTNIPYNGSGAYSESSNLQWDNTNQLIQTGRGFRVKSGYTFLTETGGSLSTILGNSVKRSATSSQVEKTSGDPGSYVRLNYTDGISFHTNFTGAASTSVAEANNQAGGFDLSKVFYVGPKATKDFSITSAGKISKYNNSAVTDGQVMIGHTSNGTFEKANLTPGLGITITNGAGSVTIAGNSTSGTYTPTLTGVANVAASTAYEFKWSRTDSTYTVSGEVDIDPTTTATLTQLGISFPPVVSGTIANAYDASGTAGDDLGTSARIVGDVANTRFELRMTPTDVSNRRFSVIIQLKVNTP